MGKRKLETNPVLVLDSFTALRSKSYSFSYGNPNGVVQNAEQKRIQKALKIKVTYVVCLILNVQCLQIIQFVETYINYQLKNKTN